MWCGNAEWKGERPPPSEGVARAKRQAGRPERFGPAAIKYRACAIGREPDDRVAAPIRHVDRVRSRSGWLDEHACARGGTEA